MGYGAKSLLEWKSTLTIAREFNNNNVDVSGLNKWLSQAKCDVKHMLN